jgi:hypothetical protein
MGVVYLTYFVLGIGSSLLTKGIVVPTDAAATANHILAHQSLYRSAIALDLIANLTYATLTVFFFTLFGPVNRRLALIAMCFSLIGCTLQIAGNLLRIAPLVVLRDPPFPALFAPAQSQAIVLLLLRTYSQVFSISFVCFGSFMLVTGLLMLRSDFLPRLFGVLWIAAAAGWLLFLWPPLARSVFTYILIVGGPAEAGLMLWLLVKGVNASRWREFSSQS